MIIKNFDFGWQGVKAVSVQEQILYTYLRKYYNDQSKTILINTTWILDTPKPLTIDQLNTKVAEYTKKQYQIFAGSSWPNIEQIINGDVLEFPETIKNEIRDFKLKIDQYKHSLVKYNYQKPYMEVVADYVRDHKTEIDNVIIYSFLDPPKELKFLDQYYFNVIKIGGNPKPNHWIDFHAINVDEFFIIDQRMRKDAKLIEIPFMCLNGKPHKHRRTLVKSLIEKDLHKIGLVSFGGMPEKFKDSAEFIGPITLFEKNIRPNDIYLGPFDPMSLGDIDNWNRHFLNIVTETVQDVEKVNWWSEKIFKPIIGYKPFLVYAPNGCVNILTEHGFLHYCYDFADISDLDLTKPNNIPNFLKELSNQPVSYLKMKYDQLFEKILYNKQRFDVYVKEQWETINKGL